MHNHDQEFARFQGRTYYEWTVEKCPQMCYEFDVLGAAHGAIQLYVCMTHISGRIPLIHKVKPVEAIGPNAILKERILGCPLGDGNSNIRKFL